jgi:hypothetical protein
MLTTSTETERRGPDLLNLADTVRRASDSSSDTSTTVTPTAPGPAAAAAERVRQVCQGDAEPPKRTDSTSPLTAAADKIASVCG